MFQAWEVSNINIFDFFRFRRKYSFEVNVIVILCLLVAAESVLTLASMLYVKTSWYRVLYWLVLLVINIIFAELALHERYLRLVRGALVYGASFVLIPVWSFLHGNINLGAIFYIGLIVMAINLVANRMQRWIVDSFIVLFLLVLMIHDYTIRNYLVVLPLSDELAVYYMAVIPLAFALVIAVVTVVIDKYKSEHVELRLNNQELQRMMRIDMLTGLYNKQYLNEQIKVLMAISRRNEMPLSVLVIDIDYFKNYNDCYGHIQGDRCLVRVAESINNSVLRDSDNVFRFGGEEFVVLLHNVNSDDALIVGQRIVDNVLKTGIEHTGSQINNFITVSVGLFTYDGRKEMTTNSVIRMADEALYKAKNEGRNRICTLDIS